MEETNLKSPETRRDELLAAAEALFRENGVDRTAVSDIVKKAGVSQGTFYNYYQSKDEIFAAVLEHVSEHTVKEIQKTAERKDLDVTEKMGLISQQDFLMNRENDPLFDVLHEPRYAYAHQKYIVSRILLLQPIYAKLIRQGVEENQFDTQYPDQVALFLLTATKFVFDPAFFSYSPKEMLRMADAVQNINERIVGAKTHTPLPKGLEQGIKNYNGSDKDESNI
jgi:AcrR family transcriptional regulator